MTRFRAAAFWLAIGIAACTSSASVTLPPGLAKDHVLLAIDYVAHAPEVEGFYEPRLVTLTADGTLVLDAATGDTVTKLDSAELDRAWSDIVRSGVATDGLLQLPGFASHTVTTATNVFHVDDGTRSTSLTIDDLGSEGIFAGEPPISGTEMRLREEATRLMDDLRAMGGSELWTPPAILMYWTPEAPEAANMTIVPWSLPINLANAGQPVEHPVWERCARLDGDAAADVADVMHELPVDSLVEQDGVRYTIVINPIHEDQLASVDCP